jgi:hypothetical protein
VNFIDETGTQRRTNDRSARLQAEPAIDRQRGSDAAYAAEAGGIGEANFIARPDPGAAPVLALDLGTHCGFALRTAAGVASGRLNLAERRRETRGDRLRRFDEWLAAANACGLSLIAYEVVRAHGPGGILTAHCYGQFEAVVLMFASRRGIPVRPYAVGTVKKAATGRGNAKKPEVGAAMRALGYTPATDDEADALAVLTTALRGE